MENGPFIDGLPIHPMKNGDFPLCEFTRYGDISGPRYPQVSPAISQRAQDKENVAGYCAYEGSDAWWGPGGWRFFGRGHYPWLSNVWLKDGKLVGGLEHEFYDFPYYEWIIIIPTDFHIFQRGRYNLT